MKYSRFNPLVAAALVVFTATPAFAVDRVRNTTSIQIIDDTAWDTVAPTSSDRAVWNGTSVGGATTLGGDTSWSGILVSAGTPTSGPLFTNAANTSAFTLSLGTGGIDLNSGTTTNRGITFDSNTKLDLTANQTWKLGLGQTSANISVASVISGASSLEVTRDVAGVNYLNLAGANTYSGGLNVGANSWVRVGASSVTSATTVTSGPCGTGNLTLNDGATLTSASTSSYVIAVPQINLLGNITINQNTGVTGRLQIAGIWDLGSASRTLTIQKTSANIGSGTEGLGFSQPTSYLAPKVQNGSLTLATAAGTAAVPAHVRFNTTTFDNNTPLTVDDGVVITSQNGSFFSTGAGAPALTLNAPVSKGGGILQLGDGTNVMRSAAVHSLAGGGTVSATNTTATGNTGTVTISNGNGANFSGFITEAGFGKIALTKSGAGSQTLSGTSAYTGKTTISGGTLQFAKTTALYNNTSANWTDTNIQVDSGATLALNVGGSGEFSESDVSLLAALGTATGGFKNGAKIGIDTSNAGGSFTYGTVLANPNLGANALGLRKLGTGTLVLNQANTLTGGISIEGGALHINQPAALGSGGTITVNSGTKLVADFSGLGGPGTIGRTLTGSGTIDATPSNGSQLSFSSLVLTTFTGTINVKPSPLSNARMDINGLFGSGTTINIESGATARFSLSGGTYSGITVNLIGTGGSGPGALRLQDNTIDATCSVNLTGDGSIGSFTVTSTVDAVIADGGNGHDLIKSGDSTLVLTAQNTYSGATHVNGGKLRISQPYLADGAGVVILGTSVLDLNFDETSGQVTDTVSTLTIAGTQMAAGVYGASGSGAAIIDDIHFAGGGTLTVTNGPSASSAYDTWAGTTHGLSGGNAAFDFDYDHDGLDNGLEWILGGNPTTSSTSVAPVASRNAGGDLVLTFSRAVASQSETTLTLQYDTNLDATWAHSYVIDADGGTDGNGVVVVISGASVTATIPASLAAPGGRIFARLVGVQN